MTDHSIDISCPTGPEPEQTIVASGDKVTFNNSTGGSVTINFTASGVFNPSPGGSITIAKDGSEKLTIGKIGAGTGYSYKCGATLDTRSGTIDP